MIQNQESFDTNIDKYHYLLKRKFCIVKYPKVKQSTNSKYIYNSHPKELTSLKCRVPTDKEEKDPKAKD